MDTAKFLKKSKQREESAAASQSDFGNKIPWMKLDEGKWRVRFLPKGNLQEQIPFKEVNVHTLQAKGNNGQKYTAYIICYDWLFTHEDAQENTITPLMEMGKMKQSDIKLFQEHGCPVCRARQVLMDGGEAKETYNNCRSRMMAYWNILLRKQRKICVASLSEQKHVQITSQIGSYLIDEETGEMLPKAEQIDALSLKKGFDFQVVASGKGMGRRYDYFLIAKPKAVTSEDYDDDQHPTDLMLAVGETFRSYPEMCRLLRESMGKLLAEYGFKYGVNFNTAPDEDTDDDDEEDDDDDTPVTKSKPKSSNDLKKKKPVVDDDDDEEDEEEEPVPVKKKKTPPKPQEEDEDDEDQDEDEEEDEEPAPVPVKKKRPGAVDRVIEKKKKRPVVEDDDDDLPF